MKLLLLLLISFTSGSLWAQTSQTRTANRVGHSSLSSDWIDFSVSSFANDDNVYAYTKTGFGQHPMWFYDFGFDIPADATITRLVCTVRKFKSGRSDVKDIDGVTWFVTGTAEMNTSNYGPAMHDLNSWPTQETSVNYEQAGSGTYIIKQNRKDVVVNYNWTPDDINTEWFGFTFNPKIATKGGGAAIYIDQLTITVYFTTATIPTAKAPTQIAPSEFKVKLVNNPTNTSFLLAAETVLDKPIAVRVTDMLGRIVELKTFNSNRINIGDNYSPGLYFIEVSQGIKRKVIKAVKN